MRLARNALQVMETANAIMRIMTIVLLAVIGVGILALPVFGLLILTTWDRSHSQS